MYLHQMLINIFNSFIYIYVYIIFSQSPKEGSKQKKITEQNKECEVKKNDSSII